MKIIIVTPARAGTTLGNRITSERWAAILAELGHEISVVCDFAESSSFDGMLALHATRSSDAIQSWKSHHPDRPLLVCLTGTDLHCDLAGDAGSQEYRLAAESLKLADRIILLEPEGIKTLRDDGLRKLAMEKSTVVFQSSQRIERIPEYHPELFEVTLIGHLREVKDPFRAAAAVSQLPDESRVQIIHIGSALNEEMESKARELTESNPRYKWLGPLSHEATLLRMVNSRVTLLTSRVEGAPGVISEAIANRVPVLASRIPATLGLLTEDYRGLFAFGDTKELAKLLLKAEREPSFLRLLKSQLESRQTLFSHDSELNAWRQLLASLK